MTLALALATPPAAPMPARHARPASQVAMAPAVAAATDKARRQE